jgi:glutamine amidotransferase PdxT
VLPCFDIQQSKTSDQQAALPFFSTRRAAIVASLKEVVAFEVAFLGAIAGMILQSTNGGRQMLELTNVVEQIQTVIERKCFDS